MGLEYVLSGFNVLAEAIEYAVKELEAQNYGNVKKALEAAMESIEELYNCQSDTLEASQ